MRHRFYQDENVFVTRISSGLGQNHIKNECQILTHSLLLVSNFIMLYKLHAHFQMRITRVRVILVNVSYKSQPNTRIM